MGGVVMGGGWGGDGGRDYSASYVWFPVLILL